MDKRRWIIAVCGLLLCAVGAWGFGLLTSTDPAIAQLQQIGDQMWDNNLSDSQRDQLRGQFRQGLESMSDDQRRLFFASNRDQWSARMNQRMDEYFTLSKTEQQKRLDEIINRMVQSRNSQQQRQNSGANGGRSNDNNRGDRNRNMTDAQREERSKRRLDRSTPKQRAQFAEFRKQLDQRAQQRGVKLDDQWGRGGFRGGPRS